MNLLLLRDADFSDDGLVRLGGPRLQHLLQFIRPAVGDTLRAGKYRGLCGTVTVKALTASEVVLEPKLDQPPPPRANLDLLLAVPRPKQLKKVLPAIASLGVDRVVLVNASRVEKSYFDSKVLESIDEYFALGLEQARDTVPPELVMRERFKPFIEDESVSMFGDATRLLPHPPATAPLPTRRPGERVVLAIGPEGGWVPFEIDLLVAHGFQPVTFGPRVLRVEVAVSALIGALR